jgi:Domain of unknown function (DUF3854)
MESIQQTLTGEKDYLSPEHRKMLTEESGISEEVIRARGYWTATDPDDLVELGFTKAQRRAPALVLPIHRVDGGVRFSRLRPEDPRPDPKKPGKVIKYDQPKSVPVCLDIHPLAKEGLMDRSRRLWIVEGEKKGDALVSRDEVAIALLGVWNWKKDVQMLLDWEGIPIMDREIIIAFDSDAVGNYQVRLAENALAQALKGRMGNVS